jgi:hypothetical protein
MFGRWAKSAIIGAAGGYLFRRFQRQRATRRTTVR